MKARFPNRAVLRAQIWDATVKNPNSLMPPMGKHKISAILGALNLKEPLPALVAFDTAVFDKPLNLAEAAKTVDGVSKPAPTAYSKNIEGCAPAFSRSHGNCLGCHNIQGGTQPGNVAPWFQRKRIHVKLYESYYVGPTPE
jgi:hypothetical protein